MVRDIERDPVEKQRKFCIKGEGEQGSRMGTEVAGDELAEVSGSRAMWGLVGPARGVGLSFWEP